MMGGVMETFRHWGTVLRGSLIGTIVGAIPGEGGTVAAFLSYSLTVQASKDPESFGKGNIKGVIAPEAAINAKDGSALIRPWRSAFRAAPRWRSSSASWCCTGCSRDP